MASGAIPDSDITASSVMNSDSYAKDARLGNKKAWTADHTFDKHPWIQVNLQKGMNITAIALQGLEGSYITRFYLSYGDDGNTWMNYTVQGKTKVSFSLGIDIHYFAQLCAKLTLLNYAHALIL